MFTKNRFMIISRITLALFILTGVIGVHSVQASPKISDDTISGVDYLNTDGTLKLDGSVSGSLDLQGWDVRIDNERGPIFSPKNTESLSPLASTVSGEWSALGDDGAGGSAINNQVHAIAVNGTDVYVGGWFTNTGGNLKADHIAKWDGTTWSNLGDNGVLPSYNAEGAIQNPVISIGINGNDIYIGLIGAGGVWINGAPAPEADYIAKWDGTSWSGVGGDGAGGSSFNAYPIDFASIGDNVYVGGFFTDVKNGSTTLTEADYLAMWDGTNWSAVGNNGAGDGSLNGNVHALAVKGIDLYVGGNFTDVNNGSTTLTDADYIAKWDGTNWSALGNDGGSPLNGSISNWGVAYGTGVYDIAFIGDELYAAGGFDDVINYGTILYTADNIAKWDGANWSALGSNGSGDGAISNIIFRMAVNNNDLYVGGLFQDVNNNGSLLTAADYVAKWDGTNWSALGSDGGTPLNGSLNSFGEGAIATDGENLFVGGQFTDVNNNGVVLSTADYIAAYGVCTTGPITVQNTSDSGVGSLRQAIADICPGGTIDFNPSLGSYSQINITSNLIIDKDLIIDASSLANPLPVYFRNSNNLQVLNSTVTISNMIFRNGYSSGDGGAIWSNGNLTLQNMTIKDSHADGNGGGIFNSGNLTISTSTISGNSTADNGGAIYSIGTLTLKNSTITQNQAQSNGGGIFLGTHASLTNNTIYRNFASSGTGIYNNSDLLLLNNIIDGCLNNSGNITSNFNNILMNNFNCGPSISSLDPLLDSLADNGGPTQTMALLPESPAIDAAHDSDCPATDQRGVARPYGSQCDIGAFELEYKAISGNVGVGGAILKYGYGVYALADSNGDYSIKVLPGWSGTVIPVKSGYSFTPVKIDYTDVQSNETNQDYAAALNTYTPSHNAGETWRASITSGGVQADDDSYDPVISADGRYVAYWSYAWNLVPGDGATDIVVHDNQTGETFAASIDKYGASLPCNSYRPSISADGRFIAYASCTGSMWLIYIYDRDTGVSTDEARATYGSISPDGRYLAYNYYDVFGRIYLQDMWTQIDTQVSVSSSGGDANGYSWFPTVSSDGRYVAFESVASDLIIDDTNNFQDIFVRDIQNETTARVSVDSAGVQSNGDSYRPSISDDGRFVVFYSSATNLVGNDTNNVDDVFIHDMQTGITTRVSVNSNGVEGNDASDVAEITGNGQYIAFRSFASNLVDGDTNGVADIFLYDRNTGGVRRVSADSNGAQSNGDSSSAYSGGFGISEDGTYLAFSSDATNLVGNDTNGKSDIFVRALPAQVHYVKWNAIGANNGSSWTDAYIDLQDALSAASSGDEIWVAAGTYYPTSGTDRTISFELKNGVTVYGGFAGTETLLSQRDWETNVTILSGDLNQNDNNNIDRNEPTRADNSYHVVIGSDTDNSALLDGFYVSDGNANDGDHVKGGGMFNDKGSPSVTNVIFSSNTALLGGGLSNYENPTAFPVGSSPILTNVTFFNNSAVEGGGMFNAEFSDTSLNNVTFIGNAAEQEGGGMANLTYSNPSLTNVTFNNNTAGAGGGMANWLDSNPVLTNVTFIGNSAEWGGGMSNDQSHPTLTNVIFTANTALSHGGYPPSGGGMYNDNSSSPSLTNVTFNNNSADYGGGMFNQTSSSPTLLNVTFAGNIATEAGGGMIIRENLSNPVLTNVTFNNNSASIGAGGIDNAGNPVIKNTILWGNSGGEIVNNGPGTPNISYSVIQGGYAGGTNIITTDPKLGTLGNYGGFTKTIPLLAGSPAIDAGDDANCPATDQRGVTRPFGSHCDIGAYEYTGSQSGPSLIVNTNADTDDGACDLLGQGFGNQDCTLREAINAANVNVDANEITFAENYTITLDGAQLPVVISEITITGNGAGNTIIQANANPNTATYRIFEITTIGNLTLNNLTAQNGNPVAPCILDIGTIDGLSCGGGILSKGNLTVTNSTLHNNSAYNGGAIIIENGTVTISKSTLSNNSATQVGGAILNFNGTLLVSNSTIYGNSAASGGGVYNDVAFVTLLNNTFSGNSATSNGGAVYNASVMSLANNIMANSTLGGDCFNEDGLINTNINNLIETNAAAPNNCGTPSSTADPMLGPLANNGGLTQTMALLAGSPAIDTGDDANCPAIDQRGVTRPFGSHCDIGAYEFATPTQTFTDVPVDHPYFDYIEILYANGYTGGCSTSPLLFCPDVSMSRAQSAVFMLRGNFGNTYVPVTPTHFFKDNWKNSSWGEGWAESMYLEGLTAGCSPLPLKFCPDEILTNAQLAVFGLRLKHGMAYPTPTATGTVFADMTDTGFWGTGWAEQAYAEGLIPSCGTDVGSGKPLFCPNNLVSRGFGAYVIVTANNLTMP